MEGSAQKLLVVEDDITVARALSRALARLGFSVAIAHSCAAARMLPQSFDFAVLDLDLPDGNGVQLARELMAAGKVPSVLFFSSSCDQGLLASARSVGAVVMKSAGTGPVLAYLAAAATESAAPQSHVAPSPKARSCRASSSSSLRRTRVR